MHLDDTTDALGLAGIGVQYRHALFDAARVETQEGQRAITVVHDLERQCAQRPVRIDNREVAGLVAFEIDLGLRIDVHRIRQVIDHAVQHQLHALVLERGAAESRKEIEMDGALADATLERLDIGLFAFQILGHDVVVLLDGDLDQRVTPLFDLILHVGWHVFDVVVYRVAGVIPNPGLAGQQVDHACKGVFDTDGQHHHYRARAENLLHLLNHAIVVGAGTVELVDIDDARDFGVVGITPIGFGLRLDAARAAEHTDAAVQHLQRAIDLDGEINVAGGVDDIQTMLVPEAGGRCRLDGDAALTFLIHEIGGGGAIMDFTDLMDLAGQLEDALGGRGLARVDVGENADVPVACEVCHMCSQYPAAIRNDRSLILARANLYHLCNWPGVRP